MTRARRRSGVNVSFFAFQDIITAVTGILILIVIFLVLLLRRPGSVDVPVTEVETRSVAELEELIDATVEKIEKFATMNLATGGETVEEVRAEIESIREKLEAKEDRARLELLERTEAAELERDQAQKNLESLKASKKDAEDRLAQAKAEVAERKEFVRENAEEDQVWIQISETDKKPIIIELDGDGGVLRDLQDPDFQKRLPSGRIETEIREIAGKSDGAESYFVFFIRPSGIPFVKPLHEVVKQVGFDLGYRPLDENRELKIVGPNTFESEQ